MEVAFFRKVTQFFRYAPVLLLGVLLGCGGSQSEGRGQGPDSRQGEVPIPAVEAVQARYGSLPLRERLTGTVRATGQVTIFPEASGLITQVLAQNGDRVEEGQPLVRLKSQTSRAQLQQARANLDVARAEAEQAKARLEEVEARFNRTQVLARDTLVSEEALETQRAELESARASYNQAVAQVEQAKAVVEEREESVNQTVVRAPISGRVGQRNAEVGMRVDGQSRLYTIGRLERVRVEVPITQEMMGQIREGQRIELRAEGIADTVITAEVSRISPFLEEESYSAEAEIDISNAGEVLRPGMFVTVDVFYGESQQATLVPTSALYDNPNTGSEGVFVAPSLGSETQPVASTGEDGKGELTLPTPTSFRPVEIVAEGRHMVGIRNVQPGDWVVVVGQHLLSTEGNGNSVEAKVRPVEWTRITSLQQLQRQDLLRQFMEKQQRLARQEFDTTGTGSDSVTASTPG